MITEDDITQAGKQEKLSAESYLKGIMDFVKWTSTVIIAAILWIGNTIASIKGLSRILAAVGLVSLFVSLVIAIFVVRRVLAAWAKEWVLAGEYYTFYLLKKLKAVDPTKITEQKETEQINCLLSAISATKSYSKPVGFSALVIIHITFLVIGLILYLLAQVLSVL